MPREWRGGCFVRPNQAKLLLFWDFNDVRNQAHFFFATLDAAKALLDALGCEIAVDEIKIP